jgi:2-polyprenyl-3-methyl-5-hydroxy-6-metoxy-1,4-benzoquinol methylase
MKRQVKKEHYEFSKYISAEKWSSYYYQLIEILKIEPKNILEVGPGPELIRKVLEENGIRYFSCDIDRNLYPDYLQSVSSMEIDKKFDVVCAFQVLEHLPFKEFEKALQKLKKHSKKYVLISLPDRRPIFLFRLKVPFIKLISIHFKFPYYRKVVFRGQHYWEIGGKETRPRKVLKIINRHFLIVRKYHVPFNPHHYLFVLKNG